MVEPRVRTMDKLKMAKDRMVSKVDKQAIPLRVDDLGRTDRVDKIIIQGKVAAVDQEVIQVKEANLTIIHKEDDLDRVDNMAGRTIILGKMEIMHQQAIQGKIVNQMVTLKEADRDRMDRMDKVDKTDKVGNTVNKIIIPGKVAATVKEVIQAKVASLTILKEDDLG